jgi:hypothetical protein
MARYPVILLAGEVDFPGAFLHELRTALRAGSRLLIHPRHAAAMPPGALDQLRSAGTVEIVEPWLNPETRRPAAISDERLAQLATELLPIGVEGDPVQYQINRNDRGWVIELINNDGVVKTGRAPARVFPEVVAHVTLTPRFTPTRVVEWLTGKAYATNAPVRVDVPPGETRFVEFGTLR